MIIAPSVLSIDYSKLNEQLREVEEGNAQWIHFDVMDGHFVPNLTFGPDILKAYRKMTSLFLDVHIMVTDPEFFSDVFIDAGADMITFHYEACADRAACVNLARHIHSKGCKAGISIKPKTNVEDIEDIIHEFDLVLIMSVEPGFGGQSFIPDALEKIRKIKKNILDQKCKTLIEVDGGINQLTGQQCKDAGADVLVAGSYIFKSDIKKAIESLC